MAISTVPMGPATESWTTILDLISSSNWFFVFGRDFGFTTMPDVISTLKSDTEVRPEELCVRWQHRRISNDELSEDFGYPPEYRSGLQEQEPTTKPKLATDAIQENRKTKKTEVAEVAAETPIVTIYSAPASKDGILSGAFP
ncbi:hypothetical protein M5K25_005598 [Dendrobium thyrsiflorum]|uniref:Uncharacterized protein n=1 Tax=Dendrobium thyrsiflorum TaxID=117978 RepID=A0ABD0VJE1_DENTH